MKKRNIRYQRILIKACHLKENTSIKSTGNNFTQKYPDIISDSGYFDTIILSVDFIRQKQSILQDYMMQKET